MVDIFLYVGEPNPKDIKLHDPTQLLGQIPASEWQASSGPPEDASLRSWIWTSLPLLAPVVVTYDRVPSSDWQRAEDWPVHLWNRTWIQNPQTLRTVVGLPPGEQVYDLAPLAYPEPATRTWIWNYNLNLIGKDRLPPGIQPGEPVTDLPPRAYPEPATRTWIWNYNVNLIGKDRLPTGEQITDLPPRAYPEPATRTWTWNYNPNLIAQDRFPPGEQITQLPPQAYPEPATRTWIGAVPRVTIALPFNQYDWPTPRAYGEPATRTWTWNYNQNLIAQDKLPVGQNITDLPPRAYPEPATRTWLLNLSLTTLNTPVGKIIYDLPPRDYAQPTKTWTWNYNLNLIGKDQTPPGEIITDLPPRAYPEPGRTWIGVTPPPVSAAIPFSLNDWQISRAWPLIALRSWTWSYNLNLIGQDKLPAGEQITDLPPRAYPEPATRTWLVNLSLTTLNTPIGKAVYDLPPRDHVQAAAKTWTWNYNVNLIGKDQLPVGAIVDGLPPRDHARILQTWAAPLNLPLTTVIQPLPFNQYAWPTPQPLTQPDRGFTAFYNQNLIGKDQLPVGTRLTDLPPRDFQRALQVWIANVSQALTAQAQPFSQNDWPLPKPLGQPDRSFVAFYNPNLVGQDQLPIGARITDLPPRDYPAPATRTWTFTYSLGLIGQDRFPPGARLFELAPIGPPHPAQNRTWTWSYNQNLIGQDRLPVGQILSDLPPRDYSRALQVWVQSVNLALTVQVVFPLNQYDWPLPRQPDRPDRSFAAFYNPNLVGQDKLPVGATLSDLPPRDHLRILQTWVETVNLALVTPPPVFPAGVALFELPPRAHDRAIDLRTSVQTVNLPLITPPEEVIPPPVGGDSVRMTPHRFTRRRWCELLELIAAEEAAAAKARRVGSPARAAALAEAASKTEGAIGALEDVDDCPVYEPDIARLVAYLHGAVAAKTLAASLKAAREAAKLAAELQARADDERLRADDEEVEMILLL